MSCQLPIATHYVPPLILPPTHVRTSSNLEATPRTYFYWKHYTAVHCNKILQQTFQHFLFLTSTHSCRFSKLKVYLFNWFTWLDLDQGWNLSAQIMECTQIKKTANISARHTSHISCPTHCQQSQNISHCEITQQSQGVYSGGLSDLTGSMGNEVS